MLRPGSWSRPAGGSPVRVGARWLTTVACTVGLLAGCAAKNSGKTTADKVCGAFAAYQGHSGTTVKVYSSIRDVEGDRLAKAWEQFEACSGITVDYEGSADFEKNLGVLVQAGKAPD